MSSGSILIKIGVALLVLGAVLGAVLYGAYSMGYGKAQAEGLAALRLVQVEREEERRVAAEAYGKALADTLARYQQEVAAAEKVATTLANENSTLEAQAQTLRRQIKNATAGSTHVFSADFVRLWNNFTGAVAAAASAVPAPGGAGGTAGAGSTGTAPGAGLSGVTETDILEFLAYYGNRCQRLEGHQRAWQALAKGWVQ